MRCAWCFLVAIAAVLLSAAGAAALPAEKEGVLSNGIVEVRFYPDRKIYEASSGGRTFLHDGRPRGEVQSVSLLEEAPPLREGERALVLRYAEGDEDRLILGRGCPFLVLQAFFRNPGRKERVLGRPGLFTFRLDPGAPLEGARLLGTDGLTPGTEPRTSYTFLAGADPRTLSGTVLGWISHDRASGVVCAAPAEGGLHVTARSEYGCLVIPPRTSTEGERFAAGAFDNVLEGLEAYAVAVARFHRVRLKPTPSGYCTWYARPHGGAADQASLAELAAFCEKELAPYGFSVIQIDDQWQGRPRQEWWSPGDRAERDLGKPSAMEAKPPSTRPWWWGPAADFTRHDPGGPYPSGMARTAETLRRRGLVPGLWLMPFAWDPLCPALKEHPDYFVKRKDDGLYYVEWAGWCLDATHPGARAFLRDAVARITHDWGYGYLKLDGLWAGMAVKQLYPRPEYREDGLGNARFQDPAATNVEAYRDGLRAVREAAGEGVFLLGCNVAQNRRTLGASFGLLDGMRVGRDVGASWGRFRPSVEMGSRLYFLNRRVWTNDPDCLMLRDPLTTEQAQAFASWIALSGQLEMVSDWLPGLPVEKLDVVKRTLPSTGLCGRPVDLFENDPPRIWHLSRSTGRTRRDVIGCFNWDEETPLHLTLPLERLDLPASPTGRYAAYDFWGRTFLGPLATPLLLDLPPASCRVLALLPAGSCPRVLSTSRHVSQGMISLVEERWEASTRTLHGRSRVVGGDPYELRIVVPNPPGAWEAKEVWIREEVRTAGVTARLVREGRLFRLTLKSPVNLEIPWALRF